MKRMPSSLATDLCSALWTLADDARWRAMLAENIYWASFEPFVQTTLLWAFNTKSKDFVADRERRLHRNPDWKPDLSIMDRKDHDAWWEARSAKPCDDAMLRRLARGIVQLKVAWTPGNAYGSAVITQKAKDIRTDVEGLRGAQNKVSRAELFMGVIVSGFHERHDGPGALDDSARIIVEALPKPLQETVTSMALLDGFESPVWKDVHAKGNGAYSRLLWIPL